MRILTVTAHYAGSPDAVFADALSFDALHQDLRGLVDYHGMPRGTLHEGQSYSFTPVLWTFLRLPETHVTCTRIDPIARICESTTVQATDAPSARYTTHITPDSDGSLWTDRIELPGPPPGKIMGALTRHIHKASHRRRRGRDISIVVETI